MKNTKCVYAEYAFFDRTGIQNFLERQAKIGWMLKSMRSYIWRFQRIEPKTIHYAITYFSAKDGALPLVEQKLLYLEMCERSGWKLVDQWEYMQIFSSEAEDPTPIETDASLEIKTIHTAVKKQYLYFDLFRIVMTSIFLKTEIDMALLAKSLTGKASILPIIFLGVVLAWYIFDIGRYYIWHAKAKKAASLDGSFTETRSYPVIHWLIWSVLIILALYSFFVGLFSNITGGLGTSILVAVLLLILIGTLFWIVWYLNKDDSAAQQ